MSIIGDHMGKVLGITPAPRATPWASTHRALFGTDVPPERWQSASAYYLFNRGYTRDAILDILDHAARFGTVECCSDLCFQAVDRAAVEATLPDAPDSDWDCFPGTWSAATPDPLA